METNYYFFYLEIALKKKKYQHIYAFENISHVPTATLIEVFGIDLDKDPTILEGYMLTKKQYKKYKKKIQKFLPVINLKIFEYCLRQYIANYFSEIRKLYKENLME